MTNQKINNTIGIIGYGRFGKAFAQLLAKDFRVKVYDCAKPADLPPSIEYVDLNDIVSLSIIFVAVPIREFADTIKKIAPKLSQTNTIIDVCSVKIYPTKIMEEFLPPQVGIIATHPLFGPDSIQENHELKIVMHDTRDIHQHFSFWKNYFTKKNISVLEMTPDKHDQLAAKTQSLTHYIGRCLQALGPKHTPIDTNGYKKLLSVMQQTCNDSFELFSDLIRFNPYSKSTIDQFVLATEDLQQTIAD
jgi:prephenate dehydrogenase